MRVLTLVLAVAISACGYSPEDNDTITDIRVKKECDEGCKKDAEVLPEPIPVADPLPEPNRSESKSEAKAEAKVIIVNRDCCEDEKIDCPICPECPKCDCPECPTCKEEDPKSNCIINRNSNINNNNNNNSVIIQ